MSRARCCCWVPVEREGCCGVRVRDGKARAGEHRHLVCGSSDVIVELVKRGGRMSDGN